MQDTQQKINRINKSPEIVVGIKLGSDQGWLVKAATSIALACKAKLTFVNVIETENIPKGLGRMTKISKEHLDNDMSVAWQELQCLIKDVPKEIELKTLILRGQNPALLLSSHELFQTSLLLIIGSESHSYRWIPKSISVVRNLVDNPTLPVLVIRETASFRSADGPLKILIADDFSEDFELTLKNLVRILADFESLAIFHVYVTQSTVTGLVSPFTSLDDIRPMSQVQCLELWEKECESLCARLSDRWIRATASPEMILNIAKYHARIITDHPSHGLIKAESQFEIDIMVVGKAKAVNMEAQYRERVSIRELLDKSKSLLVMNN